MHPIPYINQSWLILFFAFSTPITFTALQYNLPALGNILKGTTPKGSFTPSASLYNIPLQSYIEILINTQTLSPLLKEFIFPPKSH